MSQKKFDEMYRINNAEYIVIDEDGVDKKITPRSGILFEESLIIVISRLDRKIYSFIGTRASARKQFSENKITSDLRLKLGFEVERIRFPSDDIAPEHIQFIEYLAAEDYLQEFKADKTKYYACYFCGELLERDTPICSACKKEVLICIVCKLPISFGDELGKCSLCEGLAHYVHFHEWLKVMGFCPNCSENIPIEGIVPIVEQLK
ncbi:MAG: hypothetical protein GPJ52_11630 [Candidatus Heimdallarchaeota archaeon]|nr:hypothetical protein [Candidatus Heimdallarchaeota archaeon]